MKKIMMILMLLSVCSSVRVIPVYAQTVDFNVTVNNKDSQLTNSDTYSRRAEKKIMRIIFISLLKVLVILPK